jgi:hypothetical protein
MSVPVSEYEKEKAKRLSPPCKAAQCDKPTLWVNTCLSTNCDGNFEDIFGIFRVICEDKKHETKALERTNTELCGELH